MTRRRFADEALPDGGVLGVDRPQPGERRGERVPRIDRGSGGGLGARLGHHQVPARDEGLLVGGGHHLAGPQRREVGRRDTTPPVPTITMSTSSRMASSTRASSPRTRVTPAGRSSAVAIVREGDGPGWRRRAWASSSAALWPVARAMTRNRSASASRTSTVCRPMLPVEPSRATPRRRAVSERARRHTARRLGPRTGTSRSGRGCRRGPGSGCPSPSRPAARLSIDSARSPACAVRPRSGPEDQAAHGFWPSAAEHQHRHRRSSPRGRRSSPSIDLDGEMWIRNLWRPIWRPTR